MINMTTDTTTARAISYTLVVGSGHMSREAQHTIRHIAENLSALFTAPAGAHGDVMRWRSVAALALQMEATAFGLDYASSVHDKPLTPD